MAIGNLLNPVLEQQQVLVQDQEDDDENRLDVNMEYWKERINTNQIEVNILDTNLKFPAAVVRIIGGRTEPYAYSSVHLATKTIPGTNIQAEVVCIKAHRSSNINKIGLDSSTWVLVNPLALNDRFIRYTSKNQNLELRNHRRVVYAKIHPINTSPILNMTRSSSFNQNSGSSSNQIGSSSSNPIDID